MNEWAQRVQKISVPGLCPVWGCRSFSGNGRLFFPFERPLGFVNVELVAWVCQDRVRGTQG